MSDYIIPLAICGAAACVIGGIVYLVARVGNLIRKD